MGRRSLIISILLLAATTCGAQSVRLRSYSLVPAESSFTVFVAKAGLLSMLAHDHNIGIRSFSGTVHLPESGIGGATLRMEADTRSLAVLDTNVSDGDRAKITRSMHEEVLESAKYPQATFASVSLTDLQGFPGGEYRFRLTGDLTLHGATRRITIPVVARLDGRDLRAEGRYTLRQTDFGIRPYSTAGGAIRVKDDVVLNFRIVARQVS